ncbi:MAG: hypothetical protein NZM38_01485 [Cytophagales bacterium]|nr:hypothetical protein [Cytophagales bacterium]MDW8383423.1 hypothetical protein [Flammeovirgaceae bacterium]
MKYLNLILTGIFISVLWSCGGKNDVRVPAPTATRKLTNNSSKTWVLKTDESGNVDVTKSSVIINGTKVDDSVRVLKDMAITFAVSREDAPEGTYNIRASQGVFRTSAGIWRFDDQAKSIILLVDENIRLVTSQFDNNNLRFSFSTQGCVLGINCRENVVTAKTYTFDMRPL